MMKKILLLSAAVLAFQALPAHAQEGPGKGDRATKMFEKQDANGDGLISEEEFLARPRAHFAKMDADKDGSITKEESAAAFAAMKEKRKEHYQKKDSVAPAPEVAPPAAPVE